MVVGIPVRQFLGRLAGEAVGAEQFANLGAEFGVEFPAFGLRRRGAGGEVTFADLPEFGFPGVNLRVASICCAGRSIPISVLAATNLVSKFGSGRMPRFSFVGSAFWSTVSEMKKRILAIWTAMGWMSTP